MVLGQKPFIRGKIHLFFFSRLTEGHFVLGKQAKKTRGTGRKHLLEIVTRPNKMTASSEVDQTLLQYTLMRETSTASVFSKAVLQKRITTKY